MGSEYEPTRSMQVIDPLHQAIERSRKIFFDRFDFGVWLRFGLIIFIANLISIGSGGGGGTGGGPTPSDGRQSVSEGINAAREYVMENLLPILVIAGLVSTLLLGLWILFTWLGSRGQMMLIRAVSKHDPGIERNWTAVRRQANSVFRFRLVIGFVFLPLRQNLWVPCGQVVP